MKSKFQPIVLLSQKKEMPAILQRNPYPTSDSAMIKRVFKNLFIFSIPVGYALI